MKQSTVNRIAADFFAPFEVDGPDDDSNLKRSSKAWTRIEAVVERDVDEGWALLLALLELAPTSDDLELLAAGPIEDFVRAHGAVYLDRIDAAATDSERLRHALSSTYGWDVMPAIVVDRLMRHFSEDDRIYWVEKRRKRSSRQAP